jgi:hypothetical protein
LAGVRGGVEDSEDQDQRGQGDELAHQSTKV